MIRPARLTDVPAFHEVMMAAGMDPRSSWSRVTPQELEAALSAPQAGGFVALDGDRVVGCVGYRPDGPQTLTLNRLATRPEVRGRGLGMQLVQAVERHAQDTGRQRVLLAVSQFNLNVLPFYEQLGYVRTADLYAYAHPASPPPVVLVKDIEQL
ncbi:GNAT family N-acetyltransferase [Deinococcus sonorensis]|uniref:GNAT family N-acetyltransferase n=2 Tax=Deinococcus sonorensis TaxID=309891 RepID=A0AAU7U927_9DEIO